MLISRLHLYGRRRHCIQYMLGLKLRLGPFHTFIGIYEQEHVAYEHPQMIYWIRNIL